MRKVAVLITNYFEDVEYSKPAKAFREAGHELVHIGLEANETVKGKHGEESVLIDKAVDKSKTADYDALFIPGGFSPDQLRAHYSAVEFVKNFVETGKPVFLICHAPQLLITADVLRGRRITGWKSIVQDIKNSGAEFVDGEVVEDGNLVSSRNPDDISAFIKTALNKL